MINYSIAMRGVNSNLFEINQAKARIKAAQAAGQSPASADVALVATQQQRAFAQAQYSDVMSLDKFARHIAEHGCVYKRTDIAAILNMAVDCLREQLLEGKKISFGDLGEFSVRLKSTGAATAEKFTAANITAVEVVWDRGDEFKDLVSDAEFNPVVSRAAQAAVLKAVKAGQTTVNLNTDSSSQQSSSSDSGSTGNGSSSSAATYTVQLSASPSAGGTVSGSASNVAAGSTVHIAAVANSGYTFTKWSDNNTAASRDITVNSNVTLTATFTATSTGGGSTDGGEDY